MANLTDAGVAELLTLFASGAVSPVDAVRACLDRIRAMEPSLGAVETIAEESCLQLAAESAKRWKSGSARPLEGVPFGLKDNINTAGIRTTSGSRLYRDHIPHTDAVVTERLYQAGAVLLAKLRTFELAFGNGSALGETRNPWSPDRSPGGSSAGPAAALAARELPLAVGTDTGGSIRVPAAYCGVSGLKPTYGRVPRHGVTPLSWTLDHVGPLARSVDDLALAFEVMSGHDPRDSTSHGPPFSNDGNHIAETRMRIGLPPDWFFEICDPQIQHATLAAVEVLRDLGGELVQVRLPILQTVDPQTVAWVIVYAESVAAHRSTLGQLNKYGPDVRGLLTGGLLVSAADYLLALRVRHLLQIDLTRVFAKVDVLITPAALSAAPLRSNMVADVGDASYPWLEIAGRPTTLFSLAGVPAMSIPSGLTRSGLPIGIQIAARPNDERACFAVGRAFQRATDHHLRKPLG